MCVPCAAGGDMHDGARPGTLCACSVRQRCKQGGNTATRRPCAVHAVPVNLTWSHRIRCIHGLSARGPSRRPSVLWAGRSPAVKRHFLINTLLKQSETICAHGKQPGCTQVEYGDHAAAACHTAVTRGPGTRWHAIHRSTAALLPGQLRWWSALQRQSKRS